MRTISTTKSRKWPLSSYTATVVDLALLTRQYYLPRDSNTRQSYGASTNKEVVSLILTYNPTNIHVKNTLTKNFELLKSDSETWKSSVAHESSVRIAATTI